MKKIKQDEIQEIFASTVNAKIAVIGDLMLDRYYWGNVNRISPEAPVPVIDITKVSSHLGGAANVTFNLKTLGLEPIMFGLIGNDYLGEEFEKVCKALSLDMSGVVKEKGRKTTVKTRVIGNNQHIVRMDSESDNEITANSEDMIINSINAINDLKAIIFQDYNKGVLSFSLIRRILSFAKSHNIPVFADPKKENFFEFKNVKLFKPNKSEAERALNIEMKNNEQIEKACIKLKSILNAENILITLGSQGMLLYDYENKFSHIPTRARHIADVSGAGDTVIAVLATVYQATGDLYKAATIANYAAGAVCELPGIVPVTVDMIINNLNGIN